jgi:hypothetical protein
MLLGPCGEGTVQRECPDMAQNGKGRTLVALRDETWLKGRIQKIQLMQQSANAMFTFVLVWISLVIFLLVAWFPAFISTTPNAIKRLAAK